MVGVEHLARGRRVEPLVRAVAPRHRQQPVEVGADHRRLAAGLAHALEPAELALGLLADVVGHLRLVDLRLVLLDHRGVVLAQLLADRLHLLAQEVLALLCLGAGLDVVANPLADLELGQAVALQRDRQLEPLGDVDRLEQTQLVGGADIGAVARGVGERPGLGHRAQEGRHAAVVAAQLEDLLDHGAVLALELADPLVGGVAVVDRVDVDQQLAVGAGARGAREPAMQARERDRVEAAGQAAAVDHLGDNADAPVLAVGTRQHEHPLGVADLGGDRGGHVREEDAVVEGDEEELHKEISLRSLKLLYLVK